MNMSTRTRQSSNAAQLLSALVENEESEQENNVIEDKNNVMILGWSPAAKSLMLRYMCKRGQKVCGKSHW